MAIFQNTQNADTLTGTQDADEFSFDLSFPDGGAGDDRFDGVGGNDVAYGGAGNDVLVGGSGDDHLDGGQGEDNLFGGSGNDIIHSGSGGGRVDTGDGNDTVNALADAFLLVVSGGKGKDTLDFRESNGAVDVNMIVDDYPVEASGFENVGGTNFDDSLIGDDGKNRLSGHDGDDTLSGGGGDDVLEGGDNNFAASNDDELSGGDGNDRLNGDTGVDVLSGGLGNDYLDTGGRFQSGNDDTALGGAGDDTIVTDAGDDLCNGGKGNDTVVLNVFNFTVVVDFLAGSLVNIGSGMLTLSSIENVTANSTRGDILSGNNLDFSDFLVGGAPVDLTFVGGAAFSSANQLRFEAGSLFGNTDADGDAEFEVALTGVSGLATTDFVF